MGTRHFTSVILNGEQKVCQYGQWDEYPTYTGVKLLEFLRDVDMQKFKEALNNTRMAVTPYDNASTFTGSTKKVSATHNQIWEKQRQINEQTDNWVGSFLLAMDMLKAGELTQQQVDDYITATRDTGCDILQYIYNRDTVLSPLELCAIADEFAAVAEFAVRECDGAVPGCGAQGYFVVDLDQGKVFMNFDEVAWQCGFNNLPQDIDRTMALFEASSTYMAVPENTDEYLTNIRERLENMGFSIEPTPEEIADLVAAGIKRFPNLKPNTHGIDALSGSSKASLNDQICAAAGRAAGSPLGDPTVSKEPSPTR